MTGWTVLARGIRHRVGRSTVVLLLAAVAVAGAVLVPGYSRAAQQSVLTDGLSSAGSAATDVAVGVSGPAGGAPAAHRPLADLRATVQMALLATPALAEVLGEPVSGVDSAPTVRYRGEELAARLAYRDGVCAHLRITDGVCPSEPGEVLASTRTAAEHGVAVGDTLTVRWERQQRRLEVVGLYEPPDPDPYWGRTAYFTHGGFDPVTGVPRTDALFTASEEDVRADPDAVVTAAITYPVRPELVRLDRVAAIRTQLSTFGNAVRVHGLEPRSALAATLDRVADDQAAIARTVPLIAAPLVLLAWFVLFLLVAAVTEERRPEIALARLRGFPTGRTARFGLGEVLLLILVAAPLGLALGLGAVELSARTVLAPGTHTELRLPVFVAAGAALAATVLAALLAVRSTLRPGVLDLLRRVPSRSGWRAGALEGAVVALAGASLLVALTDRSAPLAVLVPALLAVVAGVAVARLVALWAAVRLARARRRGRVAPLLSAAQVARRPGSRRVVAVLTVAVALLTFAATAWDVAARARQDRAVDVVGADRVYTVLADHPTAVRDAVHTADPDGYSVAVARTVVPYAGSLIDVVAIDTTRAAGVVQWRGAPSGDLAEALRPPTSPPLIVTGELVVGAHTTDLGEAPVRLAALVSSPGEPPIPVTLGTLVEGDREYRTTLPPCPPPGCRLLGLLLGRTGTAGEFTATVTVTAIRSDTGEPAWRDRAAWRLSTTGPATLGDGSELTVVAPPGQVGDVLLEYRDAPDALPVVLAGPAPADDPEATVFTFPGLSDRPEPFQVVATAPRLPRAGGHGLLMDLEYAVAAAGRSAALSEAALAYEVWASPDAPADLADRLAAAGVPVVDVQTLDGTLEQLSRRAPALGFRLYLLAAGVAVLLAMGVAALSGRVGAEQRRAEFAALRLGGVPVATLRRAVAREQLSLLGWPVLVGAVTGFAAAALMLPTIPLVEVGAVDPAPAYRPAFAVLPLAAAAVAVGLLVVALGALRTPGRATVHRVREAGR